MIKYFVIFPTAQLINSIYHTQPISLIKIMLFEQITIVFSLSWLCYLLSPLFYALNELTTLNFNREIEI